jgi:ribose 5-phosphate isomerase A
MRGSFRNIAFCKELYCIPNITTMSAKQLAAEAAVNYVENGMTVGLGSGSTVYFAILKLGERVRGGLNIKAVPSSTATENLAKAQGIEIVGFDQIERFDIDIDGADEVDAGRNLIKGGGGALLREKILAFNSRRFIVIVDESKFSAQLGKAALPVEVISFGYELVQRRLEKLGSLAKLRTRDGKTFITENGNYVLDCKFPSIPNPDNLHGGIIQIPGVVETGLFPGKMVNKVIIGFENGKIQEI